MRALACIGSAVLVIVLGFVAYRAGDVWGAFTYASLMLLLVFGPTWLLKKEQTEHYSSPLDPWRRPEPRR